MAVRTDEFSSSLTGHERFFLVKQPKAGPSTNLVNANETVAMGRGCETLRSNDPRKGLRLAFMLRPTT